MKVDMMLVCVREEDADDTIRWRRMTPPVGKAERKERKY